MARLTKDGSLRGQKSGIESASKAPSNTLIIPGKEFVQVIAKVCHFSYLQRTEKSILCQLNICTLVPFFILMRTSLYSFNLVVE